MNIRSIASSLVGPVAERLESACGRDRKPADAGADADRPPAPRAPRREHECGRKWRASQPIAAYVGINGSGKTLCMVHDTLPSLYAGRRVLSTVPLTWPDGTRPENVEVLTDWAQILDAEHADILLDEVSSIASARESEALPPQIATLLQQLRKRDLVLRWTAPSWQRADRILRETTKCLTVCHGYMSRRDRESMWRRNTLFRFVSYDARDFSDFDSVDQTQRKLKPVQRDWFVLSRHDAPLCYDTLAEVSTIGTVLMSGRCAVCGGRRRVPECSCADYLALKSRK